MSDDDAICKAMVREMLNFEDGGFTDWEIGFLESVDQRTTFTEKQKDCIEKLYKRRMP
jgi:hypothetical protein